MSCNKSIKGEAVNKGNKWILFQIVQIGRGEGGVSIVGGVVVLPCNLQKMGKFFCKLFTKFEFFAE